MAVRVKDRIEGNIRQSDKVNNSLSIQLNSGTATIYDGSASKSINITASAVGAPSKTGSGASGTWSINISGSAPALQGTYSNTAVPLTDVGAGAIRYYYNVNNGLEGNMPADNNANGILYINTHSGEYGYQLGFSSKGNIYYRMHGGSAFTNSTAWRTIVDSENYTSILNVIGAKLANSYWGMTTPSQEDNTWIRTTSLGIIPYSSVSTGTCSIGTSSWPFSTVYATSFVGNASSATYATRVQNGEQSIHILYNDSPFATFNDVNGRVWGIERFNTNYEIREHYYKNGAYETSRTSLNNVNYSSYALPLSGGTLTGLLTIYTNNRYVILGCQNQSFTHYSTNADNGHWFNTDIRVQGNIYCGSSYDKKVISEDGGYLSNQLISHSINGGTWINGTHSAAFVVDRATSAPAGNYYQGWYSGKTPKGAWSLGCLAGSEDMYFVYGTDANFNAYTNTTAQLRMASSGVLYGAAWNDYAEFRTTTFAKAGEVVIENGDGTMHRSYKRLEPAASIVSDTYGFAIGETEKCKTPIAVAGRVLAYPYEDRKSYKAGDAVCSAPDGKVSKMTREEMVMYPNCIIGYVSEIPEYEVWGQTDVPVNGRIWIKV